MSPPHSVKLEALYDRYADRLYQFCARLCDSPDDAEDLAQDVLLIAFRDQEQYAGRSEPLHWLYAIAVHRWGRMRYERGPGTLPLTDELLDSAPQPGAVRGHLDRLSLDEAICGLPASQRQALVLVKLQGLTYREAANVRGLSEGTVKAQVHQALANLRAALQDEEAPAPPGSAERTDRDRRGGPGRGPARFARAQLFDEV